MGSLDVLPFICDWFHLQDQPMFTVDYDQLVGCFIAVRE